MKTQLQAQLLRKIANKKADKGFTLIELLVVTIIIGVLAAVALPNLLGQVGKARETAAKTGVGTLNRAEQTYHFERQDFSPALDDAALAANNALGVIVTSDDFTFTKEDGVGQPGVNILADGGNAGAGTVADDIGVRAYSGRTEFAAGVYTNILCQSDQIAAAAAAPADTANCAADFTEID